MKKLYGKNLLAFALILIGVYVVGMSVLDSLPMACAGENCRLFGTYPWW